MIQNMNELSQARAAAAAQLAAYDCRILVCSGTGCIATGSNKIHEIFEELSLAREKAVTDLGNYDCRILVCSGTGCIATGSNKIHEIFEELVKKTPGVELVFSPCGGHHEEKAVGVKKTGCQGFCELGPLVRIQKGEKVIQYVKVQPEDCEEIIEKTVLQDELIERLLYHKEETSYVSPDEIPFIAKQTRIVLENCGKFDAESLDEYLAAGGFEALKKAMFELGRDGDRAIATTFPFATVQTF